MPPIRNFSEDERRRGFAKYMWYFDRQDRRVRRSRQLCQEKKAKIQGRTTDCTALTEREQQLVIFGTKPALLSSGHQSSGILPNDFFKRTPAATQTQVISGNPETQVMPGHQLKRLSSTPLLSEENPCQDPEENSAESPLPFEQVFIQDYTAETGQVSTRENQLIELYLGVEDIEIEQPIPSHHQLEQVVINDVRSATRLPTTNKDLSVLDGTIILVKKINKLLPPLKGNLSKSGHEGGHGLNTETHNQANSIFRAQPVPTKRPKHAEASNIIYAACSRSLEANHTLPLVPARDKAGNNKRKYSQRKNIPALLCDDKAPPPFEEVFVCEEIALGDQSANSAPYFSVMSVSSQCEEEAVHSEHVFALETMALPEQSSKQTVTFSDPMNVTDAWMEQIQSEDDCHFEQVFVCESSPVFEAEP